MDEKLYNIIALCTDGTVIWANENGRQPSLPFFMLDYRTTESLPVHFGLPVASGNEFERSIAAHRNVIVELTAYGQHAYQKLDEILLKLQGTVVSDYCALNDVAIVSINSLKDIPELVDTSYRPRAQLEFTYRYTASVGENVDVIEEVHGAINTPQTNGEIATDSFISTVDLEV